MATSEDFAAFAAARWERLVRAALLMGCSSNEAEDLVQATLERCLVHWSRVRKADDVDAYVHRMLLNTLRGSRRRFWNREHPTALVPDLSFGPPATDSVDLAESLGRALARLGPSQRAVVVLRFYANLTEAQTASVLGIPIGTVKSRASRALASLSADATLADLRGT